MSVLVLPLVTYRTFRCLLLMTNKALRALFTGAVKGGDTCREMLYILRILPRNKTRKPLRLPQPNTGEALEEDDEAF